MDMCVVQPGRSTVDWANLLTRVLPLCDMVSPSLDDMRSVLANPALGAAEAAEWLLERGAAVVVVTDGPRGMVVRTAAAPRFVEREDRRSALLAALPTSWHDRQAELPAVPVPVVETTGAGDAATAALLVAVRSGMPLDQGLELRAIGCRTPGRRAGVACWVPQPGSDDVATRSIRREVAMPASPYRLNRLFNAESGRALDVAVDHGFFGEPPFLSGIENMSTVIETLVEAGPDAIQLQPRTGTATAGAARQGQASAGHAHGRCQRLREPAGQPPVLGRIPRRRSSRRSVSMRPPCASTCCSCRAGPRSGRRASGQSWRCAQRPPRTACP